VQNQIVKHFSIKKMHCKTFFAVKTVLEHDENKCKRHIWGIQYLNFGIFIYLLLGRKNVKMMKIST